ncbi:serine hydrolase [Streptomyces sp. NPDC056144]|uniref:serine hydrolase n=1 Tax=unclassified Streptomyces TaxID=2593676 RepID=UPI0035DCD6B9
MRRIRTALLGAAAGLAVMVGTAPAAGASTVDAVAALQNGVTLGVSRGYPGAMGLIRDGQSTTYVKAGSSTAGSTQPIDPAAKFRIGSNTKLFTAVTVLQLEAEGRLSLNDTPTSTATTSEAGSGRSSGSAGSPRSRTPPTPT